MFSYLPIIGIVALLWLMFWPKAYRISFLHLILIYWTFQTIAVFTSGMVRGDFYSTYLIVGGIGMWILGIHFYRYIVAARRPRVAPPSFLSSRPRGDLLAFSLLTLGVVAATVYHYGVGGIPLFAAKVKVEAFDMVRSGLFGIPGRIFRFGPLFLIFLIGAYYQLIANPPRHMAWLNGFVLLFALVAYILNGHKSAIVIILQALIIVYTYQSQFTVFKNFSMKKIIGVAVLAVLGFVLLAINLDSSIQSLDRLGANISERVFYISGRPFDVMVTDFIKAYGFGYGKYYLHDLNEILAIVKLSPGSGYNTSNLVSAMIHGRDVMLHYIVPTTTTVFGGFYVDFGVPGLLVCSFLYGIISSWLYVKASMTKRIWSRALFFQGQLMVFTVATKGNMLYSVASTVFAIFFIFMLLFGALFISRLIVPHRRSRSRAIRVENGLATEREVLYPQ